MSQTMLSRTPTCLKPATFVSACPVFSCRGTRSSRRCTVAMAVSQASNVELAQPAVSRRVLLGFAGISAAAATGVLGPAGAHAEGGQAGAVPALTSSDYNTFYGFATPPTSYGGYGGNADEPPKYSFEYPAGWTTEKPSKVEKGTQGVDGRVVNPRSKDQRAFLITLTRAGEDNQSFKLRDLDSTFQGFAGADYALQDAIQSATNTTQNTRTLNGVTVYDYDIESPDYRYLSSIIFKDAKVFALFIRSPARLFKASEAKLRHIQDSFRLL